MGAGIRLVFGIIGILVISWMITNHMVSAQIEGQVNIVPTTCGLDFVSGSPINFGDLKNTEISAEQVLQLNNTGNTAGTATVVGTVWNSTGPITQMEAATTKFSSSTNVIFSSKTAVSPEAVIFSSLAPNVPSDTFWQVVANLINPNFVGNIVQQIVFTITCP